MVRALIDLKNGWLRLPKDKLKGHALAYQQIKIIVNDYF
jgi:hypothetical protein